MLRTTRQALRRGLRFPRPAPFRMVISALIAALVAGLLALVAAPPAAAATCPCTIWAPTATPSSPSDSDTASVELGLKFQADTSGVVTGVRFYKGAGNTGTHVGRLWSRTGTMLATVNFTGESASGWQQASFPAAVPVTAGQTYVVSYLAPNGRYAGDNNYFTGQGVTNAPLTALASGVDGANGVYLYGTGGFPTNSYQNSNYWVDVVYSPTASNDTTPPAVTGRSPTPGATGVSQGTAVTATFSESVDPATIAFSVTGAGGAAVAGAVTYDGATSTATFRPSASLAPSTVHNVTVSGARDLSGNTMATASTWSFTTGTSACPCSIWGNNPTPATPSANDPAAVELGVKFRSSAAGFATGVRFYKGPANTGTHVGSLWSATGTLLGRVNFTNESASGWQVAAFPSSVAIAANTTYVISYFAPAGGYAANQNFFAGGGVTTPPLTALGDGVDGGNGVYIYGPAPAFPTSTYQTTNYWVDVVFNTAAAPDTTPPTVVSQSPLPGASNVAAGATVTVGFSEQVDPATIAFTVTGGGPVAGTVTYDSAAFRATFTPAAPLAAGTSFTATVSGARDIAGNAMTAPASWSFSTGSGPPPSGPGGPILVLAADGFGRYLGDILQAEGLNEYLVADLSTLSASLLAGYDAVLLGPATLSAGQISTLTTWVNGGGNLIAMRPDAGLAGLLGVTPAAGTLANGYVKVDTTTSPGTGIVADTMQFHGTADRYTLAGGTQQVATLYSATATATANPAVTLRTVGTAGGQAAAFTYDLARSVIYTRQGNPAWAGQERDGTGPIRSDDLFWGLGTGADWVDPAKISIPQADEQQRLLANLVGSMTLDRKPLPRFWYLPGGHRAAVVMTGDDHGTGGTAGRFDKYVAASPAGCVVADWQCVRSTSYIYPGTPITNAQAASYTSAGFEIGLHTNTGCNDFTASSLASAFETQSASLAAQLPANPAPVTNRTHCIPWSDWSTGASVMAAHGVGLDTNYYYWPAAWAATNPGLFTGSGFPMRHTTLSGDAIGTYQATTQMVDEADQPYPATVNALLDKALGPQGFYGTFVANMHTDASNPAATEPGSAAIVAAAQARGVPVISAKQLLTWVDGRNSSSFGSLAWSGSSLSFTLTAGAGSRNLQAMVPLRSSSGASLSTLVRSGVSTPFTTLTVKGVDYAVFSAAAGSWQATYGTATPPPPPVSLTDTSAANFTAGTVAAGGYVGETGDGDVMLAPALGAEFSGTALPAGWSSTLLSSGGTSTVSGGRMVVDGTRAMPATTFASGRSVEFAATFTGQANQVVGFGVDVTSSQPWAAFAGTGGGLSAVTINGAGTTTTALGTTFLNGPHTFRIDWTSTTVTYSVDGVVRATHSRAITAAMRPLAVDATTGGGAVTVDWVRVTPYAATTTFTSRVLDGGAAVRWLDLSWGSTLPANTSVAFSIRTGNTAVPDGTWTAYVAVPSSGSALTPTARYLQYRAVLTTTNTARSPVVSTVTARYQP